MLIKNKINFYWNSITMRKTVSIFALLSALIVVVIAVSAVYLPKHKHQCDPDRGNNDLAAVDEVLEEDDVLID